MEPGMATRTDKKGQTAFHMAAKGQNIEIVEELIVAQPSSINMVDTKGNTALHIATRKGRIQVNFSFFPTFLKYHLRYGIALKFFH
jgi:ankyrin repeat protein